MSSVDESSALKRNSVHQTRLSLELQQLEKDRAIRLREMQKASQVFAKRQEQIQNIREKASLRRVPSAPVENSTVQATESNEYEDTTPGPFVTKTARLQSAPGGSNSRRPLQKTATMPSLDLLPSRSNSSHLPHVCNPAQRGTTPKRTGFVTPLEEKPNSARVPMYSRNFSGLRQRDELVTGLPARKSSLGSGQSQSILPKNTRSKSVSS